MKVLQSDRDIFLDTLQHAHRDCCFYEKHSNVFRAPSEATVTMHMQGTVRAAVVGVIT